MYRVGVGAPRFDLEEDAATLFPKIVHYEQTGGNGGATGGAVIGLRYMLGQTLFSKLSCQAYVTPYKDVETAHVCFRLKRRAGEHFGKCVFRLGTPRHRQELAKYGFVAFPSFAKFVAAGVGDHIRRNLGERGERHSERAAFGTTMTEKR